MGAGQHHFPEALVHSLVNLGYQRLGGNATLAAPHLGHNAVGANLVAPLLYLHHSPVPPGDDRQIDRAGRGLWIPAFAGMTKLAVGMTKLVGGVTKLAAGVTKLVGGVME